MGRFKRTDEAKVAKKKSDTMINTKPQNDAMARNDNTERRDGS